MPNTSTGVLNILIVDDSPANVIALETLLEKEGRRFLTASDGNEALKIARKYPVDLILLDVQMAGMDGFEVAQILKSSSKTKDIPVIFASASNKEQFSILQGYKEGAVDYLLKPLNPEITRAKVAVLLENQRQKKELIEKNALLQTSALLIENSVDILGIIDQSTGVIEKVNEAVFRTLGMKPDEITGCMVTSVFGECANGLRDLLSKPGSEYFRTETCQMTREGKLVWLSLNARLKDGKWYVNASDITRSKESELKIQELNEELSNNISKLEEANRELESFSYSVSHDLMAPVRAIKGYAQILEEDSAGQLDPEGLKNLAIIKRNALRMKQLIEDLLAFSKLSRGELKRTMVNMQDIVSSILHEFSDKDNRTTFRTETLFPCSGDQSMLTQVWVNLISNAVKYSSKNPQPIVEIGSSQGEREITYCIKDNGVGFDMAHAARLFDVFQRLHDSKEFEGTGIGLATVDRIIRKHGGRVWAEAETGKGAVFCFSLPV